MPPLYCYLCSRPYQPYAVSKDTNVKEQLGLHTLAGMQAAPTLNGLEESNDNATKRFVKGKRSGRTGRTTEHSLDGGFGVVAFRTIDKARGSERIDGNVTARDLSVKVNDCGSDGLANIGSNANKGKVGSGLDNVNVGGHESIQGWKVKRSR